MLTSSGGVADWAVLVQCRILGEQEMIGLVELLQSVCQISEFGFLQSRLRPEHQGGLNHCNRQIDNKWHLQCLITTSCGHRLIEETDVIK